MDLKTRRMLTLLGVVPTAFASAVHAEPPAQARAVVPETGQQLATWTFHHEQVLGTSLQVSVRARDRETALHAEAAALAVFDRDAATLSAWRADSEFSRWAATRFEAVPVSEELFTVLAAFDVWRERTGGALDPSVEAATRLWKQATAEGRVPTAAEIAETREAIAQPHWSLDPVHRTATRLSDVPLALASFAKSWITSRAADAALRAGAAGVTLNVGGDVVVRGAMTQMIAIADPKASAENDAPMEYVAVNNGAVATSGGYRRGFALAASGTVPGAFYSHLIDPRTAQPAGHVLSSTVYARDAETAGALATAFSVLPVAESERMAASMPGVQYLLVNADGSRVTSRGWSNVRMEGFGGARYVAASLAPQAKAAAGMWDPNFELTINLALPRIDDFRYRRPYVAVWVEDADHMPVRTIALWAEKPRYLSDLRVWYHDDQTRSASDGTDLWRTVSTATRPPGSYTLKWDGKDNQGKPVKSGTYTVVIEAAREHGGYQVERKELSFTGKPAEASFAAGDELGAISLEYKKR